jgi:hypothetical protein
MRHEGESGREGSTTERGSAPSMIAPLSVQMAGELERVELASHLTQVSVMKPRNRPSLHSD